MAIGYHVTFGAYGFWLPNDPRGSWSDVVRQIELYRFGPATKTDARRSVADVPHDHQRRSAAKAALQRQPVRFTGDQARAVGRGFAEVFKMPVYACHACAVMPDHVHLVIGLTPIRPDQAVRRLKQVATQRLKTEGLWDAAAGSPWSRGCWKVYLDTERDVQRAITYVEHNPVRDGLPRQRWPFVRPWRAW